MALIPNALTLDERWVYSTSYDNLDHGAETCNCHSCFMNSLWDRNTLWDSHHSDQSLQPDESSLLVTKQSIGAHHWSSPETLQQGPTLPSSGAHPKSGSDCQPSGLTVAPKPARKPRPRRKAARVTRDDPTRFKCSYCATDFVDGAGKRRHERVRLHSRRSAMGH